MLTLLGPTACGKTALAVRLAARIDAEIISADSRQVYRGMDIGTGKDLNEYTIDGHIIPHHLIDVADPGETYNLFRFKQDCLAALKEIHHRQRTAILCGGTGMYIEAILRDYRLDPVPYNAPLRQQLNGMTLAQLRERLATYKTLHNTTDTDTIPRALRAIEIADYYHTHPATNGVGESPPDKHLIVGLTLPRDERRRRISERLTQRLQNGMVDEVRHLISQGVSTDILLRYGLEYRYITMFLLGRLTYDEMRQQLEIAIHQFAKRQMTWFRGMERRGIHIHWLSALDAYDDNINRICTLIA